MEVENRKIVYGRRKRQIIKWVLFFQLFFPVQKLTLSFTPWTLTGIFTSRRSCATLLFYVLFFFPFSLFYLLSSWTSLHFPSWAYFRCHTLLKHSLENSLVCIMVLSVKVLFTIFFSLTLSFYSRLEVKGVLTLCLMVFIHSVFFICIDIS